MNHDHRNEIDIQTFITRPRSLRSLKRLLADRDSPLWYRRHFAAFCYLDNVQDKDMRAGAVRIIEDYLMRTEVDAGLAAWKAAETLGEHFRSNAAVTTLCKVATNATHRAGRKAALHGIEHALRWNRGRRQELLWRLVYRISQKDRSTSVRESAEAAVKGFGCVPNRMPLGVASRARQYNFIGALRR